MKKTVLETMAFIFLLAICASTGSGLSPIMDPEYYNERGLEYAQEGDFDNAIAEYTRAILLDPKFTSAYHNRGFAYFKKQDFDRAIADYTEAIRLNPKYADAYCPAHVELALLEQS